MLIAKQKRKENIAEYILYLYQVEDLIRAFQFDMNLIQEKLISNYQVNQEISDEIRDWYSNLAIMMDKEAIRESGHLQFILNLINDLYDFHLKLLETENDKLYVGAFQAVAGLITELRQKNKTSVNDIQLTLDTIYGFLLLKMKKTKVSDETTDAVKRLSHWMSRLSKFYNDFETGDLEL